MRLSALQRYIIRECYVSRRKRINRQTFVRFYHRDKPTKIMNETITKSLERLIDKGLMIGYGRRTPEKWFIDEVQLTPTGRRAAKKTFGLQQHLPFK